MTALLGGLAPRAFLAEHWQKRPLLVRQAIPGFDGIVGRDQLLALATREDATSRLVIEHPKRRRGRWERHDGPFAGLSASMLPASHWTLLVHGVESLVPGGWELLRRFDFLPAARIDDLMMSYAAEGGGVGPHDDQYDVFLLQGPGRRRWRISTQADREVDPDAAIRVLADFRAEEEWVLEPGDMLYLPPHVAHFGTADRGPCSTYSIGFLAPTQQDLVGGFLSYLAAVLSEAADPAAIYTDPDLRLPRDPLEVDDAMLAKVGRLVGGIGWDDALLAEFLGCFLTRPKPRYRFHPPARPLSEEGVARRRRLALALPTRALVRKGTVFVNGVTWPVAARDLPLLKPLFRDRRVTLTRALADKTVASLHAWHREGWVTL
jgi:50S ribosomal protein L16 3-hydroxylase